MQFLQLYIETGFKTHFSTENIFEHFLKDFITFSSQSCECVSRGFNSKRNWLLKRLIAGNRCVFHKRKSERERECVCVCVRERERKSDKKREGGSQWNILLAECHAIVQVWQNIALSIPSNAAYLLRLRVNNTFSLQFCRWNKCLLISHKD